LYLSIPASYYQLNGSAPFKIAHHRSDTGIAHVDCWLHQAPRVNKWHAGCVLHEYTLIMSS